MALLAREVLTVDLLTVDRYGQSIVSVVENNGRLYFKELDDKNVKQMLRHTADYSVSVKALARVLGSLKVKEDDEHYLDEGGRLVTDSSLQKGQLRFYAPCGDDSLVSFSALNNLVALHLPKEAKSEAASAS